MGCAGLGEDLARQNRDTGACTACGKFETLKHFVLDCPAYSVHRTEMLLTIANLLYDDSTHNVFFNSPNSMMFYLLADHNFHRELFN